MKVKQDEILATEMEWHAHHGFRCRICGAGAMLSEKSAVAHVRRDWRKIEASMELWTRKVKP